MRSGDGWIVNASVEFVDSPLNSGQGSRSSVFSFDPIKTLLSEPTYEPRERTTPEGRTCVSTILVSGLMADLSSRASQ